MPTRIIRDGILTSERVNALDWGAEVFYRRLMSVADDYGRFYAHPSLLRAACYPLHLDKVSDPDVRVWIDECVQKHLVKLYEDENGKRYVEIQDFGQRVQSKSKFPSPHKYLDDSTVIHGESRKKTAIVGVEDGVEVVLSVPNGTVVKSSSEDVDETPKRSKIKRKEPCPIQKIVDLYHEVLPELPRVQVMTKTREGHIRQRWLSELPSLDHWRNYFEDVRESDFLMGRIPPKPGRGIFLASLEWLTKQSNFAKVAEGNYHHVR